MAVPQILVEQFTAVANCDASVAEQQLLSNDLDVEVALANYFAIIDAGGDVSLGARDGSDSVNPRNSRDEEQLEADNIPELSAESLDTSSPEASPDNVERGTGGSPEVPDGFGDVAGLTPTPSEDVDPDLRRANSAFNSTIQRWNHIGRSVGPAGARTGNVQSQRSEAGPSTASESPWDRMFRPPFHIRYNGEWDDALAEGVRTKKWILVNIQDRSDFASLCMNRDVWSDDTVQQLIQARFLFYQHDVGSSRGKAYRQFYPFDELPHVALIDPRSGERLIVWGGENEKISKSRLAQELIDFIENHDLDDDRSGRVRRSSAARTAASSNQPHDVRETEDAQVAAAIEASMANSGALDPGAAADVSSEMQETRQASNAVSASDPALNEHRSLRAQQDSEYHESLTLDKAKAESERMEQERLQREAEQQKKEKETAEATRIKKRARVPSPPPAGCASATTELVIRLPDGERKMRRFYASNTVGNVYDYIEAECDGLQEGSYVLMTSFPRKSYTDRNLTLNDADLFPKAALFVHED